MCGKCCKMFTKLITSMTHILLCNLFLLLKHMVVLNPLTPSPLDPHTPANM